MAKRDLVERLKTIPLFAQCSGGQLRHIANRGAEVKYPEGAVLCKQGQPGDDFFVILDGKGEVTRNGKKVRTLGPGDYFGEVALLGPPIGKALRTATVTATTPMRCFILGKSDFRAVIYEKNIAVSLLHALVERLPERAMPHPH
jgi:CRP/FNR family transcriptional regulator, cyclic AMP receptor protein